MMTAPTSADVSSLPRAGRFSGLSAKLSRHRKSLRAASLVAPLFLFLCVFFFYPIGSMLYRSVDNPEVREAFPTTLVALRGWGGNEVPGESAFAALVEDLKAPGDRALMGRAARRLNYELEGFRTLVFETRRSVRSAAEGPYKPLLIAADPRWGELSTWSAIARNNSSLTDYFLLTAVDLKRGEHQNIARVAKSQAIFLDIYSRTFLVSAQVAIICLLLGYPFAYLLAHLSTSVSNILMFFVLLPFWTALLARTTAWIVLLQREGLVNDTLRFLGITSEPLQLVFNRTGVLIAMTHVLLPFAILPLYSTMKSINPIYVRAAQSLGAKPSTAFWKIYFPQTRPGLAAAGLLVFILSVGYYVTPALVGGTQDQLISSFIALYTDTYLNWGQASALAAVLLVSVATLYSIYYKITGSTQMQLR
ncbi:ABC transporter permease [Sinorhizobium meliloti]|uniref:ABC transporter permease n=1 Tax=Rhizobium meliloti TaxID=382 RepID=UPI003D64D903